MTWTGEGLSVLLPVGGLVESDPHRQRSFDWLIKRYMTLLPDAELCFGQSESEPYNRSEARNNAYEQATQELLLVADADTLFNVPQIAAGVSALRTGAPWVIPYRQEGGYLNLSQWYTNMIMSLDPSTLLPEPHVESCWEHKLTSCAGLLMLRRSDWKTAGGYPERAFTGGWSYEDDSWRRILDVMLGRHQRIDSFVMHCWHPVGEAFDGAHVPEHRERFREYQRAKTKFAMQVLIDRYGRSKG